MRVEELRIGNLVQDQNSNLLKIIGLTTESKQLYVLDRSKFPLAKGWKEEPIPLTEEWLLKFGFEYKGGEGYEAPTNTSFWYFSIKNGFIPSIWFDRTTPTDGYKGCNHVHQLQNLYFALTGEELEII